MQRGKIQNRKRAKQIKDFSGLRWDKITPTDLDAFVEFDNQIFIFIELKYREKQIDGGQKLAFERLVDIVGKEKEAILIVARHEVDDPEKDIDAANCEVIKYRFREKWMPLSHSEKLKDFCDRFISMKK